MIIAGVDEAGRGPCLAPMVLCLATIDTDSKFNEQYYKDLGIKDSKLLSPKKRKELYNAVRNNCKFLIAFASPEEIDNAVSSETYNLNWLEADKTVSLINQITINKITIDCPSPNLKAYREYITNRLNNKEIEVSCEHKADVNHVVVSLASVIAKHVRDTYIKIQHKKYGDFGSGYPSDPKTKKFVKENPDNPLIRKSWSTYKKLFPTKQEANQNKSSDT